MTTTKSSLRSAGLAALVMFGVLIILAGVMLVAGFLQLRSSLNESNRLLGQLENSTTALTDENGQPSHETKAVIAALDAGTTRLFDANTVTYLLTVLVLSVTAAAAYAVLKARDLLESFQAAKTKTSYTVSAIASMADWLCRISGMLTCSAKTEITAQRMAGRPPSEMSHHAPAILQHLTDLPAELKEAELKGCGIPKRLRDLCRNQIDTSKQTLEVYLQRNLQAIVPKDQGQFQHMIDLCEVCVKALDDEGWVQRYENLMTRLGGLAESQ